jgi:DNA polymerase-3 subunit alpha
VGLRVYVDDQGAPASVLSVLSRFRDDGSVKTKGPVTVTALGIMLGDGPPQDVSLDVGDGWPVSPQIKGALKSLPGVVLVEDA